MTVASQVLRTPQVPMLSVMDSSRVTLRFSAAKRGQLLKIVGKDVAPPHRRGWMKLIDYIQLRVGRSAVNIKGATVSVACVCAWRSKVENTMSDARLEEGFCSWCA